MPAVDAERTTLKELIAGLEADYQANGRRSLGRVRKALKHVKAHFPEDLRVVTLTTDRITAYTTARLEADAAPATVNRELAALKRMLRLGERAGTVLRRPHIAMLEERNVRRGFFEADQVRALVGHLPGYLQPVITAAAATGWRVHSELLTRQWRHVDLAAGWLRLEPGETKTR